MNIKKRLLKILTAVYNGENYEKTIQDTAGGKRHFYCIDLLKFIGILLVLTGHGNLMRFDFLNGGIREYIHYYLRSFMTLSVPLFFLANGFLLFNKELNLKKHIMGMVKLAFLAVFWGTITLFLIMLARRDYLDLRQFITYLWRWKQGWINHLWFIGTLIILHLFFPLLKLAYDKKNSLFIYFLSVCFIFTFGNSFLNMLACFIRPSMNTNFFNMFNPFRNLYGYTFVYFMIGGTAGRYYDVCRNFVLNNRKKTAILSTAVLLLSCVLLSSFGVLVSHIHNVMFDNTFESFSTVFALINVCCVYCLSLLYSGKFKLIKITAKNTLGIYFVHMIIIDYTRPFITELFNMNSVFVDIAYGVIILLASLAVVFIIKKIPFLRKTV